jgi:hypothetical protein
MKGFWRVLIAKSEKGKKKKKVKITIFLYLVFDV